MNGRFQIALHIMTILCTTDEVLSSGQIADSLNINPVLARKELSNLIHHGLVTSHEGKNGGYQLSRQAKDITLSAIYESVKPAAILGIAKNKPNPACRIGRQIDKHLHRLYEEVDQAVMQKLGDTDLLTFCKRFK